MARAAFRGERRAMHLLNLIVAGTVAAVPAVALPVTWINTTYEEELSMATVAARTPGAVSRTRFMLGVLGGLGAVIGFLYVGASLRYLYPKNGSDTPPLNVMLDATGVTDPLTGSKLPFQNGVAGPFFYPTTADKSVVVGVFVEKKVADGALVADNVRVVEQTCTHLGCPVSWVADPTAPVEPTGRFECPCHGSQFHRDLSVAHGPANVPLYEHEFTLAGTTLTVLKRKA